MKTLVIGLGNPILGDDGVGWVVAGEVARRMDGNPDVEVDCLSLGGLSLMERLTDYRYVILVDAIASGRQPAGTVSRFPLAGLPDLSAGHTTAAHDTSLRTALNVGRSMGVNLPTDENVIVVAIEAAQVYDFSEELSPPVAASVPRAVQVVMDLLDQERSCV